MHPEKSFSLDAAVSAAVVVVDPGFAMEDFVSDVLPGPDKESSASVSIRMIVLAGSRRCSWSLTAVALRLFFLPVNPVFIRIKDLVQSDRALARPSWSHPASSSDSSEALVDDFLAASFAAACAAIQLARFLINVSGADTLIDRNMTNQLRIRRKPRYLRDMAAVLLNIRRNLIIILIKQELMKLFFVVLQCLRDNAVTDLSNILLTSAAGNPRSPPIWNFAILRASGIKSVISTLVASCGMIVRIGQLSVAQSAFLPYQRLSEE